MITPVSPHKQTVHLLNTNRTRLLCLTKMILAVVLLTLGVVTSIQPLYAQSILPSDVRLNGKKMWKAFEAEREILQSSSAVVYTDEKSHVKTVYGVVVRSDGYILTKASEVVGKSYLSVRIGKELFKDVKIVETDPQWDVAMLKVESDHPFTPVVFSQESDVPQGHWVVSNGSTSRISRRVRVGIVSAITHEIKSAGSKVILGVLLSKKTDLKIEKVSPKSGAEKAGLKEGDVIQSVDGKKIEKRDGLIKALLGKSPKDVVDIEVLRDGELKSFKVELMARSEKEQFTRNDQMSGILALSSRRTGFPRVIHHDTPLSKHSVGGPLLNLDGECVGMNIARASRVATYAIPARELLEMIPRMIRK